MSLLDPVGTPAAAAAGVPHLPLVELHSVSRRFGTNLALDGVDLRIESGSVHALIGENGAGKSTMMRIIAGDDAPTGGQLRVDGVPAHFRSPKAAQGAGISLVAQELALEPDRTVLENVLLGVEPRRAGFVLRKQARRLFDEVREYTGIDVRPDVRVADLSLARQQLVEIMRSLARGARLIIMDEPTARLASHESGQLLDLVDRLRADGRTVLYVTHALKDVLRIADTITVLRDGRLIQTTPAADQTEESLVRAMIGRPLTAVFPERPAVAAEAPVVLEVQGLSRAGAYEEVDLTVRAGEIVGMAGLVGSGRSEVARGVFGADPADRGTVRLHGRALRLASPRDAIDAGIAMVPEDRKELGVLLGRSVAENVLLPHLRHYALGGWVRRARARRAASDGVVAVDARVTGLDQSMWQLSGGNQQKVLFARWTLHGPDLLIIDEPTRGVDVAAKARLYQLIADLARDGMAVLLISSELDEVLGLAHRVVVMRGGRVVHECSADVDEEAVMIAAFGADREHGEMAG